MVVASDVAYEVKSLSILLSTAKALLRPTTAAAQAPPRIVLQVTSEVSCSV